MINPGGTCSRALFALLLILIGLTSLPRSRGGRRCRSAWQKVSALEAAGKLNDALQLLQASPPASPDGTYYYNLGTLELKLGPNRLCPGVS